MHFYLFLHIFTLLILLTTQNGKDPPDETEKPETEKETEIPVPENESSLPDESDVKTSTELRMIEPNPQFPYNHTTPLDNLPRLLDFFGLDLRTGTYIIVAVSVVHLFFYGCTLFMRLSYMLVSIWVLITLYSTLSIVLFVALGGRDPLLIMTIWIWYALIFVALMFMMMILVALVLCAKAEHNRLFIVLIGMAWYTLTVYFILVVNSHRMELVDQLKDNGTAVAKLMESGEVWSKPIPPT